MRDGIGRLEFCQLQDAFIHGRNRKEDRLARAACDVHLDHLLAARAGQIGRIDRQGEGAGCHVDGHVGNADSAAGFRPQDGIAPGIDIDHHIGALAPFFRNRKSDAGSRRTDREILNGQNAVGCDNHLSLTIIGWQDRQLGILADLWRFLGGNDLDAVRRFCAVRALPSAPADIETGGRADRRIGALALDDQFVASPFERWHLDLSGTSGGGIDHAFIHLCDGPRTAPVPAITFAIPVVMIVDLQDLPAEALGRCLPVSIDGHDLECRVSAFGDRTVKARLQADIEVLRAIRHTDAFRNRAPARFQNADHRIEAQRNAGIGPGCARRQPHQRLARAIGRHVIKLQDLLLERLVVTAIGKAVKCSERLGIRLHPCFCLDGEARARRAVQETGGNIDGARCTRFHRLFLIGRHIHRDALGNEVFNREPHLASRRRQPVDLDAGAPFSPRRAAWQREALQDSAGFRICEPRLGGDEPVGPIDHEMTIAAGDLASGAIAQHCGEFDSFAGAIDAAIGIDIGIHRAGRSASTHGVLREIDRRPVQVQRGEFSLGIGGNHQSGRHRAFAIEERFVERDAAGSIGLGFSQYRVVCRQQLHSRVADCLAILQGAEGHIKPLLSIIGGEGEVCQQDPPARGSGRAFSIAEFSGVFNVHKIGAGLHWADDILQREDGDDRRVLGVGDVHRAGEDFDADIFG